MGSIRRRGQNFSKVENGAAVENGRTKGKTLEIMTRMMMVTMKHIPYIYLEHEEYEEKKQKRTKLFPS